MKVWRYHCGDLKYAYIKANFWEKRALMKRIASGCRSLKYAPDAYGPQCHGAQFILMNNRRIRQPSKEK